MIRDLRVGTCLLLIAAAISLPPAIQAVLLAVAWLLPHIVPSVFTPSTPQRRSAWSRFQPFAVLFVLLSIVIQGIFGPDPRVTLPLGSLSGEGIDLGLAISLRAILILTGIFIVLMPLRPLELAHGLTRLRLPVGIPVAVLLSLQLVEDLPHTIQSIRRAQRSRGLKLDGTLPARLRAIRYLITPVVMRSLEGSLERATALQLRGLLDPALTPPPPQRFGALGAVLVILSLLLIILRVFQWSGLLPSIV